MGDRRNPGKWSVGEVLAGGGAFVLADEMPAPVEPSPTPGKRRRIGENPAVAQYTTDKVDKNQKSYTYEAVPDKPSTGYYEIHEAVDAGYYEIGEEASFYEGAYETADY